MSQNRLPAEIYWRRRFLLLAAVLLVVWGAVQVWPGGAGAESGPAPSATGPSASTTPEPDPEPAEDAPAEPESTTVSLAAGDEPCEPESIRMTPHVPTGQVAGSAVRVDLVLSTVAEEPCTFRPAGSDLVAVISAGDAAVWDSDVCSAALLDEPVQLSPRWSTLAPVSWSGRGSGPTCSAKEGWAPAGTYTLRIGALGGEPGTSSFQLEKQTAKQKAAAKKKAEDAKAEKIAREAAEKDAREAAEKEAEEEEGDEEDR